jgi:4-amino-4-deoxy-L-arabinose transferase-like glycosyltransferase
MGIPKSMIPTFNGRAGLLVLLATFALLVAWGWVGFLGSDDVTYAIGGYGWLEHFPFVGGHGTIRYPITIPIALSFWALGQHEFSMVLPSLLYMAGFLILAWASVRRAGDGWLAFGALLALITCPLLVIQSSIASVDIVELACVFASVILFWRCTDNGPNAKRLFFAGAIAGIGFLTRETAIFIALFYAVFFAIGYRFHRGHYLWIAAGFLAIWGLELIYLGIMTGDPLYRINISLHHDSSIDRTIDLAGNIVINPWVDPFLVLFANQEFMALFFVGIPLGSWLCFARSIPARVQNFARIIAMLGLVWFAAAGAAQTLLPLNPRYFMISAASACILTGMALAMLFQRGKAQSLVLAVTALLIALNMLGIYVENKEPLFGERQLATLAAQQPKNIIYTDPMTRYRADMLLRWKDAQPRILSQPPAPGSLYFYNPAWASRASFMMKADQIPVYAPQASWEKLGSWQPEPPLITKAIEAARLSRLIPSNIWKKLRYHHPPVTLYRVRQNKMMAHMLAPSASHR